MFFSSNIREDVANSISLDLGVEQTKDLGLYLEAPSYIKGSPNIILSLCLIGCDVSLLVGRLTHSLLLEE